MLGGISNGYDRYRDRRGIGCGATGPGDRMGPVAHRAPAAAASLTERPELGVTAILLIAIPETMAILGFVVAVLILMRGA